ncbi:dihydrofolate reductase [Malassezia cuniculi]|uniref:Dihydrofolate reductase n=1 Tax=Malassezia cuniculi TaxID=948313 RepID=A0AAF0EWG8_9BASI|nr:dihydrofolate reductase [Malassezia cuniculi]
MKFKVLVLHGYASNGPAFSKRLAALRNACRDVADFYFPVGPHHVQALPSATNPEPGPIDPTLPIEKQPRAWWVREDNSENYVGWNESVAELREYFAAHGPFDGILGFSQGASVSSTVAATFEQPGVAPETSVPLQSAPLKFAIIVSGFVPREPNLSKLFDKPIELPSLHVIGREDAIVEPKSSEKLAKCFANARVEFHDGGHFLPTPAPWRNFVRDYIASFRPDSGVAWQNVPGPNERTDIDAPKNRI